MKTLNFFLIILPGALLIYFITKTIRITIQNKEYAFKDNQLQKAIYVIWHNRLFLLTGNFCFRKISVLISQSRDGELIARVVRLLGYEPVRGSATRGGAKAILEILKNKKNDPIVLTVDGPRGPKYEVKQGAIYLAAKTGLPIIPLSYTVNHKKILKKSWDNFIIPYPFSKATISFGEPIYVKENLTKEDMENYAQQVRQSLLNLGE